MQVRRYIHGSETVEAMRFVGNAVEIAAWAGGGALAHGVGLTGSLTVFVGGRLTLVETGDWVVRGADGWLRIEKQEHFCNRYRRVEHADVE